MSATGDGTTTPRPDTSPARLHRRRAARAALALMAAALAPSLQAAERERTMDDGGRSAGRVIDDATITTRIKASFVGSKEVKARDIQVETRQGVVQLSGFADSREESERAAEIARSTPGVKSVTNAIQMQPATSR